MKAFEGLGVALVTPFNEKLEVDYNALTTIFGASLFKQFY